MSGLKEAVIKRKSIRKYLPGFSAAETAEARSVIAAAAPLYKGVKTEALLLTNEEYGKTAGGMFIAEAPCYIVIKSEPAEGHLLNAGFLGQNIVLALTEKGFGTCWLGGAKSKDNLKEQELPYVISIALGRPAEPFRKDEGEAKRKSIFDIAYGCTDIHLPALNAARLAPSAMNRQPARYKCSGDKLDVYRKKPLLPMLTKLQEIDCGIALANIIYNNPEYKFSADEAGAADELAGCVYVGTLRK